jgi:catechol 2,3-dioxygenase
MTMQGPIVPIANAPEPIDPGITFGHIVLHTADIDRVRAFYVNVLGFDVTMEERGAAGGGSSGDAIYLAAGGYYHHLVFNTRKAPGGGLDHLAIRYPTRRGLADALRRLRTANWPLHHFTDYGHHESIYVQDLDGITVELAWDRPFDAWPRDEQGHLVTFGRALDLDELLGELGR